MRALDGRFTVDWRYALLWPDRCGAPAAFGRARVKGANKGMGDAEKERGQMGGREYSRVLIHRTQLTYFAASGFKSPLNAFRTFSTLCSETLCT